MGQVIEVYDQGHRIREAYCSQCEAILEPDPPVLSEEVTKKYGWKYYKKWWCPSCLARTAASHPKRVPICTACNTPGERNETYDAYYCTPCDIWIEQQCGDADCPYCPARPARPSEAA